MKSQELRIGNLVNYEQTIHIITGIAKNHTSSVWVGDLTLKYIHKNEWIKPIKINEWWLLMLGLIKQEGWQNNYSNGLITLELNYSKTRWYDVKNNIPLDYVHELQNLYYCLTGNELDTKRFIM